VVSRDWLPGLRDRALQEKFDRMFKASYRHFRVVKGILETLSHHLCEKVVAAIEIGAGYQKPVIWLSQMLVVPRMPREAVLFQVLYIHSSLPFFLRGPNYYVTRTRRRQIPGGHSPNTSQPIKSESVAIAASYRALSTTFWPPNAAGAGGLSDQNRWP